MKIRFVVGLLSLALAASTACGGARSESSHEAGDTRPSGELTVFAAASLTGTFTDIAAAFEAEHPDSTVTVNFGSSSSLVAQIIQGAPADVYASADVENMAKLAAVDGATTPAATFARNRLQIIVEPGNPKGIASIGDLGRRDVVFVTAADEVPIGRYGAAALDKARVDVTPKSYEANVKAIVTKVVLGEADAGIVYATDVVAAAGQATGVEIPAEYNVQAEYPIAATTNTSRPELAQEFVDFVLGTSARRILAEAGFSAP